MRVVGRLGSGAARGRAPSSAFLRFVRQALIEFEGYQTLNSKLTLALSRGLAQAPYNSTYIHTAPGPGALQSPLRLTCKRAA